MNRGEVYIQRLAFDGLYRSAYENPKKECLGNLFGYIVNKKNNSVSVVESAQPLQFIKRTPDGIIVYSKKIIARSRLRLSNVYLGDFHSHVEFDERTGKKIETYLPALCLSEEDKKDLRKCHNEISLVMTLKEVERRTRIGDNPLLLTGHIKDDGVIYRVEIGGYYYNGILRRAIISADKDVLKIFR